MQASDGNFYGTTGTGGGGSNCWGGCGTVFKITSSGTLTTLHSFNWADGADPMGGLVQASDGNFYGTTGWGGAGYCDYYGCGTVFKITPSGTLTTLYSFCSQSNCADGGIPRAGLIQASDGSFYGTTSYSSYAGADGYATVFKITTSGTLTTLYSFADGAQPYAGLVQATDGNFYGTTASGGSGDCSWGGGCGTVFKIISSGTLTTLHSFNYTDGAWPNAPLVQASDGNFYGTTAWGGANGYGTVFKITPSGTLTTLHSFADSDGASPDGLVQATDGNFYGTTYEGGANNDGTVFRLVSVRPCFSCSLQWK